MLGVGFEPGEPQERARRRRARRAPRRRAAAVRSSACSCPTGWSWSRARPALRRAHLDQVVAALWPTRAATRAAYAAGARPAQRPAGRGSAPASPSRGSLPAWDAELARHGVALMADRADDRRALAARFADRAVELGLDGASRCATGPRSDAAERRGAGGRARRARRLRPRARLHRPRPHRDELVLARDGPRAARLRLAGPAAPRPARAAAGRARGVRRARGALRR